MGSQNDEKMWVVRPWMGKKSRKPRKLLFRCFRNAVFIDFGSQIGQKSDAKSIKFRSEADKNMTRRQEHNETQTSKALLTWTTEVGLLAQNLPRTCRLTNSYRRTPTTKRGRRCSPPWGAFNWTWPRGGTESAIGNLMIQCRYLLILMESAITIWPSDVISCSVQLSVTSSCLLLHSVICYLLSSLAPVWCYLLMAAAAAYCWLLLLTAVLLSCTVSFGFFCCLLILVDICCGLLLLAANC